MAAVWILCGLTAFAFLIFVNLLMFAEESVDTVENQKYTRSIKKRGGEGDIFDDCPFDPPTPWHKSLLEHVQVKYGFDVACAVRKEAEPVTQLVNKTIKLLPGKENFTCEARCVTYRNDRTYNAGNWSHIYKKVFECDFVETNCSINNSTNRFVHMQIAEKKFFSPLPKVKRSKNPDVHIILIDSVASTQVRAILDQLDPLHPLRYWSNRQTDQWRSGSSGSSMARAQGKTTEVIEKTVMKLGKTKEDLTDHALCRHYLDDLPYIPLEYYNSGYKTLNAEDYVTSFLHYPNCKGMKKETAHHYHRPFRNRIRGDKELRQIHYKWRCRKSHNHMLDYHSLFLQSYSGFPKFSLVILIELTHDNSQELYKSDYDLYNYFLNNRDALNDSFVFFMSDHGPRFGKETNTSVNREEQKNPFLYIVIPKHLRNSQMHKQLKTNSKEIVTNHDLHSTLKDILYFQPAANFTELEYRDFNNSKRGSSLLRRFEAGVKRNCKTLPIPFQYCICQYTLTVVTDQALRQKLVEFAVGQLDSLLRSKNVSSSCEKIQLGKIVEVYQYYSHLIYESHIFDVTFEVAPPAKGKFQTPIRMEKSDFIPTEGTFTRLDRYGKSGNCMRNADLRPYCTCKTSAR